MTGKERVRLARRILDGLDIALDASCRLARDDAMQTTIPGVDADPGSAIAMRDDVTALGQRARALLARLEESVTAKG